MADESLIDQFNAAVKHYDAQTNDEWQHKAVKSLCKKFRLLVKSADSAEEADQLVTAMIDFTADYIHRDFTSDNPGWEAIDGVTQNINLLKETLFESAGAEAIPSGSAKRFSRLAAKILGDAENTTDGDSFDAFQEQADAVAAIANAMEQLEMPPASAQPDAPPAKPNSFRL